MTIDDLKASLAREFPDVSVGLSRSGDALVLDHLFVPVTQRRRGVGTAVLRALMTHADAEGTKIALTPSDGFGTPLSALVPWYARNGFLPAPGGRMQRYAVAATSRS